MKSTIENAGDHRTGRGGRRKDRLKSTIENAREDRMKRGGVETGEAIKSHIAKRRRGRDGERAAEEGR